MHLSIDLTGFVGRRRIEFAAHAATITERRLENCPELLCFCTTTACGSCRNYSRCEDGRCVPCIVAKNVQSKVNGMRPTILTVIGRVQRCLFARASFLYSNSTTFMRPSPFAMDSALANLLYNKCKMHESCLPATHSASSVRLLRSSSCSESRCRPSRLWPRPGFL